MNRLIFFCALFFFSYPVISKDSPLVLTHNVEVKDTIDIGLKEGERLIVKRDIDLMGRICILPQSTSLIFSGGIIKNGILFGNNTKMVYKRSCFENIEIKGTWKVPTIKSTMFLDIYKVNSLHNLIALANPSMTNIIYISEGDYYVKALKNDFACIDVPSKTHIKLRGIIRIIPNDFNNYYVVKFSGDNSSLVGGEIVGDKFSHLGNSGQWGMGIHIWGAKNCEIRNVIVKDCWGDCIYIGGNSHKIKLFNCKLDNGRRQGVSVTSAETVLIQDCTIINVAGHSPEYGIDIEPNANQKVDDVLIKNVNILNCQAGIMAYGLELGAKVGTVQIVNCKIKGCKTVPVRFYGCDFVNLSNCIIESVKDKEAIHIENNKKVKEKSVDIL